MSKIQENKTYDCSRGCTVEVGENGVIHNNYRQSSCKLEVYDTFKGIHLAQYSTHFEVRFKNTRKGIYVNDSGQHIKVGDFVVVEAQNGYDVGIVTLEGPAVAQQIKAKRHYRPREGEDYRKIYRKARPADIQKWQEATAREQETMVKARELADRLGLDMRIGDVEFQGDGTKAIFYYIADQRVDFRQLIKDYAEEFHIRIEMKQIGARQNAGLIGGLGICGRELCCSNYITSFQSISTVAAKIQDLSLNPVKLAGQCGKLKCCLNYEAAQYYEAQKEIPKLNGPLEFEDGLAYLMKTDVLGRKMFFSFDKTSVVNMIMLTPEEVSAILEMNAAGKKAVVAQDGVDSAPAAPEFVSAAGEDSLTRFDKKKKKKGHGKGHGGAERASADVERGGAGEQSEGRAEQRGAAEAGQRDGNRGRDRRRHGHGGHGGNGGNSGSGNGGGNKGGKGNGEQGQA